MSKLRISIAKEDNNCSLGLIISYIENFLFKQGFKFLRRRSVGITDYIKKLSEKKYPRLHSEIIEHDNVISFKIHVDTDCHVANVKDRRIPKLMKSLESYLLEKDNSLQLDSRVRDRKKNKKDMDKKRKTTKTYKLKKRRIVKEEFEK